MNKLVSYGSESDEETSKSPRRPSSSQDLGIIKSLKFYKDLDASPDQKRTSRKDSEFWSDFEKSASEGETSDQEFSQPESRDFEPPPPKRHSHISTPSPDTEAEIVVQQEAPKGKLPIAHSTSSLVSMGVDESDEFEREYQESMRPRRVSRMEGGIEEPSPPKRKTVEDEMSVDRSPGESDVDQALEEGLNALKEKTRYMEEGQSSPRSLPDSDELNPQTPRTPRTPVTADKDIIIPASPPGEAQAKFNRFWKLKEAGRDMNAIIKNEKKFKNPAIYDMLIEKFGLDEIGSNFPKSVFDPHAFNEDSFYEELAAAQKKVMDAQEARASKKGANSHVTAAAKAKLDAVIKHHEERKTRFEKPKK